MIPQRINITLAAFVLLFVCSAIVSGTTITAQGGTIPSPGDTGEFTVIADSLPNGLAGFTMTFTLSNPDKADITGVVIPQWAYNPENQLDNAFVFISPLPDDAVEITLVDLYENNNYSLSDLNLVTLKVKGISSGSTDLRITDVSVLDDWNGDPIDASTENGQIIIGGTPLEEVNGAISIASTPEGADILLDGDFIGVTPLDVPEAGAGVHTLRLEMAGYEPHAEDITVNEGLTTSISWTLSELSRDAVNGTVSIESTPEGADILLDGEFVGVTPFDIPEVGSGVYTLRLEKAGYEPREEDITVEAGLTTRITWTLPALPLLGLVNGTIEVNSIPRGADVYLDGELAGITPVTIADLAPGQYSVLIQKDGYEPFINDAVIVAAGNTTQVSSILAEPSSSGERGSIDIVSIPSGADVVLDDAFEGRTPLLITNLDPGACMLRIEMEGYTTWYQALTIVAGETIFINAPLTPLPTETPTPVPPPTNPIEPTGGLYVISDPTATLLVDGVERGTSNDVIDKVPAGTHQVTLVKPGYAPKSVMVNVAVSKVTVTSKIVLEPGSGTPPPPTKPATPETTVPTTIPTTVPTTNSPGSGSYQSPITGGIFAYSVPFICSVSIDDVPKGASPGLFPSITPGTHLVKVTMGGYKEYVQTVTVKAGEITIVSAVLIPDIDILTSVFS